MAKNKPVVRVRNFRSSEKSTKILREIQLLRAENGKDHSLTQLYNEAICGYFQPELNRQRSARKTAAA